MPIPAGKNYPFGMTVLTLLVMAVVATQAKADNLALASNNDTPGSELTNAFNWSSVASTETRLARCDLRITNPSNDSSPLGKFIGEFRLMRLLEFQKPNTEPTVISSIVLDARQSDCSDQLSFRLGPWLESSLTEKILLRASGGFALGLLDAGAGWNGTSLLAESSLASRSSRTYFKVASGLYAGVDAIYHLSERWGIGVGAQFQNLIFSNRNISEHPSSLNWSQCILFQAGFSYNF